MVFYGASGHAKVVVEAWLAAGGTISGFVDDNPAITTFLENKVFSSVFEESINNKDVIISIGSNGVRRRIANSLDVRFGKVIHPKALLSQTASVGIGSVVLAGAIINAFTTLGTHTIINTGATVDHDCSIGDFVHIAPNATLCGGVVVGEDTLIGAGAIVIPQINIGRRCIIGAGSVVINDVPDDCTVVGNPARMIRRK